MASLLPFPPAARRESKRSRGARTLTDQQPVPLYSDFPYRPKPREPAPGKRPQAPNVPAGHPRRVARGSALSGSLCAPHVVIPIRLTLTLPAGTGCQEQLSKKRVSRLSGHPPNGPSPGNINGSSTPGCFGRPSRGRRRGSGFGGHHRVVVAAVEDAGRGLSGLPNHGEQVRPSARREPGGDANGVFTAHHSQLASPTADLLTHALNDIRIRMHAVRRSQHRDVSRDRDRHGLAVAGRALATFPLHTRRAERRPPASSLRRPLHRPYESRGRGPPGAPRLPVRRAAARTQRERARPKAGPAAAAPCTGSEPSPAVSAAGSAAPGGRAGDRSHRPSWGFAPGRGVAGCRGRRSWSGRRWCGAARRG